MPNFQKVSLKLTPYNTGSTVNPFLNSVQLVDLLDILLDAEHSPTRLPEHEVSRLFQLKSLLLSL